MDTIVKFGKKGKVKRAKAVEVQKLQEHSNLQIGSLQIGRVESWLLPL